MFLTEPFYNTLAATIFISFGLGVRKQKSWLNKTMVNMRKAGLNSGALGHPRYFRVFRQFRQNGIKKNHIYPIHKSC